MPERAARSAQPRGLKTALPVKPCATCGRPMAWRRAWARCWDEVRHCSDACRRRRDRGAAARGADAAVDAGARAAAGRR